MKASQPTGYGHRASHLASQPPRTRLAIMSVTIVLGTIVLGVSGWNALAFAQPPGSQPTREEAPTQQDSESDKNSAPSSSTAGRLARLLQTHCVHCHNESDREAGVRIDNLDVDFGEGSLKLWEAIQKQVVSGAMPPESEPAIDPDEHRWFLSALDEGLMRGRSRRAEWNGAIRRLTVTQYRNALRDLLGIQENLTKILPPDALSKDGFSNNAQVLSLSPLLIESYFQIADQALQLATVDEAAVPTIQHFRMDLGRKINPEPCPDNLVLGANNLLLRNEDFVVTEPPLEKPFPFRPFAMQRSFRFIEGYQGNDTVREWRDFQSIYHAVFACMRGSEGYPKGRPYEAVPDGLLLRPAIPSSEIFGESNTYGPHANFKVSLRELPDHGRFRVTVRAAKYDDGILLDHRDQVLTPDMKPDVELFAPFAQAQTITIREPGIYQVDAALENAEGEVRVTDGDSLRSEAVGLWNLDGNLENSMGASLPPSQPTDRLNFVASPFGNAVSFDGYGEAVAIENHPSLHVGSGEFTIAAWIRPRELRQCGIVSMGGYGYRKGWILDMPANNGVLRLETAHEDGKHNGTVQTVPGMIKVNQWQHVAAVVRRGEQQARLYINGYEVARGTIGEGDLSSREIPLGIGRVFQSEKFVGDIDAVYMAKRALDRSEIQALVEPGRALASPPFPPGVNELRLRIGDRHFSGALAQTPFLAVRLNEGSMEILAESTSPIPLHRIALRRVPESHALAEKFLAFERRSPELGVHLGLRRDCGSTMNSVGNPQRVTRTDLETFVFEDAIANYPSPDVEPDNVNYLAGIREIGVRSEYTDGRDMPRLRIASVEFEGPLLEAWPPQTHRSLYSSTIHVNDQDAYARDVLSRFAKRAFRRPPTSSELASFLSFWRQSLEETGNLQESLRRTMVVVLTSPQFLFLVETSHTPEAEDLDDYELASKLSFFLWNAPPDEPLMALAETHRLRDELHREIDRMVDDPRFAQCVQEFATQWLGLEKIEIVETDGKRFPNLTRDTKVELQKEPIRFLEHAIRQNFSIAALVRSNTMVVNDVVANYYGFGDRVELGLQFQPVPSPGPELGGVLTHAAILAGLSDGREANPVKRGAWFARRMVAMPPDDPPPNVPKLEDLTQLSLRERLERHRNVKGCVQCHNGIDPWGLPFEAFDAAGLKKRDGYDARSSLPTGAKTESFEEFQEYLMTDLRSQMAFSVYKHLTAYAIGRSLTYNEMRVLRQAVEGLGDDEQGLRTAIHNIVSSDLFLKK